MSHKLVSHTVNIVLYDLIEGLKNPIGLVSQAIVWKWILQNKVLKSIHHSTAHRRLNSWGTHGNGDAVTCSNKISDFTGHKKYRANFI